MRTIEARISLKRRVYGFTRIKISRMGKEASVKDKQKDVGHRGQDKYEEKRSNKNARPNKKEPPVPPLVSEKELIILGKIPVVAGKSSDALVVTSQGPRPDV